MPCLSLGAPQKFAPGDAPRREPRPRCHSERTMVDWFLAQQLARSVAGEPDMPPPRADLRALADDSAERVIAYTGLTPARALPAAEWVGRAEWIAANVGSMR